jgi:predicted RNA binding protein YcfA (HicA-like mRNA interferase family)
MGRRSYPPLTPAEVIAILVALGFTKKGQTGSHAQYFRPADGRRKAALVTVDMHIKDFDHDLMHSMVRQSEFSAKQFYGATKATARRASIPYAPPKAATDEPPIVATPSIIPD